MVTVPLQPSTSAGQKDDGQAGNSASLPANVGQSPIVQPPNRDLQPGEWGYEQQQEGFALGLGTLVIGGGGLALDSLRFGAAKLGFTTAGWRALTLAWANSFWLGRTAIYEAGSKTFSNPMYKDMFLEIKDAVTKGIMTEGEAAMAKGILTIQQFGWFRALRPDITVAYKDTISTGLTPLAQRLWPLIAGAAAGGFWAAVKVNDWYSKLKNSITSDKGDAGE